MSNLSPVVFTVWPVPKPFSWGLHPWLPEVSVIDNLAWLRQGHFCQAPPTVELLVAGRADKKQERVFTCQSDVLRSPDIVCQQWMSKSLVLPWVRNQNLPLSFLMNAAVHLSYKKCTVGLMHMKLLSYVNPFYLCLETKFCKYSLFTSTVTGLDTIMAPIKVSFEASILLSCAQQLIHISTESQSSCF